MKLALSAILLLSLAATAQAEPVSFKQDVAPVLLNNCLACHGPKKAEGTNKKSRSNRRDLTIRERRGSIARWLRPYFS
jgi:hypothetical protein